MHQHLKFRKICEQWVPHQLTTEQRNNRMALSLSNLQRYHEEEYGYGGNVSVSGQEDSSSNYNSMELATRMLHVKFTWRAKSKPAVVVRELCETYQLRNCRRHLTTIRNSEIR
ncbi:hypothetical protein AVEN_205505-1 [Araneus ventricosus]|uniref:Uncharacterized protein n=1 Tax=Araneus ventricosus TaxID=182803 RepID=A0A4Y2IQJ3_ARAVE|nr:hypothetical protein AVEN_121991-1 [Araneus ventricosus]GBM79945.1 hypothetical protein AVEN_205505-1 [Araneus ventricosus]